MRDVSIIGIGQVPVGDLWEKPIYILAVEAMLAAIHDSKVEQIDSVYIGNMLSSTLAGQDLLATLAADQVGLDGCGSRQGRSGLLVGRHCFSRRLSGRCQRTRSTLRWCAASRRCSIIRAKRSRKGWSARRMPIGNRRWAIRSWRSTRG